MSGSDDGTVRHYDSRDPATIPGMRTGDILGESAVRVMNLCITTHLFKLLGHHSRSGLRWPYFCHSKACANCLVTAADQKYERTARGRAKVSVNAVAVDPMRPHLFATGSSDPLGMPAYNCHTAMNVYLDNAHLVPSSQLSDIGQHVRSRCPMQTIDIFAHCS